MSDENLILLIDILDKMGTTGDPANADGTVLARLAELLTNRLTSERAGKLDLIGTAADAAGTSTLFARLAQIAGYTDTVESTLANLSTSAQAAAIIAYVDELETRLTAARAAKLDNALLNTMWTDARAGKLDLIGAAADAAGTTSLFARLAQIADYVDTLETKLGLNTDAAGTTTLFARLAQIAGYTDQVEGYVDTLEANLGAINPPFGSGGFNTIFKALRLINDRMLAWTRHGKESAGAINPAPSSSFATYLDISGYAGQISNLYFNFATNGGSSGGSGHIDVRITIDDDVYIYSTIVSSLGANSSGGHALDIPGLLYVPMHFINNFKIEYRTVVDSGTYYFTANSTTNIKYRYMAQ